MDEIRYSELRYLDGLASGRLISFNSMGPTQAQSVGLDANLYPEMVATLLEDGYVRCGRPDLQYWVQALRRELYHQRGMVASPREELEKILSFCGGVEVRIT